MLGLIFGSGFVFSQCTATVSASSESIKALGQQRTKSNSFIWVCKGKSLILNGNSNTVYAEDSVSLNVSGDSNTVYQKNNGTLNVSGTYNKVRINYTASAFTDNGTFTNKTNCTVVAFDYSVAPATGCDFSAGIESEDAQNTLSVYPVPSSNTLYLNSDRDFESDQVSVFSMDGKRHAFVRMLSDKRSLDISDLKPGIYLIELKNDQGRLVQKFIKE